MSIIQVNLCQKLLFLHQLTHNIMTDCSLNYKFNTWKFQAQTWGEHVVYRNCFWHSEHFLYITCSPYVLQKEELLTKIYLNCANLRIWWSETISFFFGLAAFFRFKTETAFRLKIHLSSKNSNICTLFGALLRTTLPFTLGCYINPESLLFLGLANYRV